MKKDVIAIRNATSFDVGEEDEMKKCIWKDGDASDAYWLESYDTECKKKIVMQEVYGETYTFCPHCGKKICYECDWSSNK